MHTHTHTQSHTHTHTPCTHTHTHTHTQSHTHTHTPRTHTHTHTHTCTVLLFSCQYGYVTPIRGSKGNGWMMEMTCMMSNVRFKSVDSQISSTEEPSLTSSALNCTTLFLCILIPRPSHLSICRLQY